MSEKVVGILGGMGPGATVNFLAKVIALTPAQRDQDHLRIIIDNNPKIPDRTEAILTKDKSLLPILIETAKNLERANADFIVIPCNTVHYFYENLVAEISIPILHMVSEVAHAVNASLPGCKRIGLIATIGTVASDLYQKKMQRLGVKVIVPDPQCQAKVMDAIRRIKAGYVRGKARKEIIEAGNLLIERDAQALILGCTDVSLVVKAGDFPVPVFDSTEVLAKAAVKFSKSDTISA